MASHSVSGKIIARRSILLASAAGLGLTLTAPAYAQDIIGPPDTGHIAAVAPDAQGGFIDAVAPDAQGGDISAVAPDAQTTGYVRAVAPSPNIVISDPGTPTTARDPDDITGIGQMVTDIGGGFIGLCTGTLINPRTVLFAAHCVNDEAASSYGAASGGTPIGFGFSNYNIPGLVSWYFGGNQTNTDLAFYNANYVAYNPLSTEPGANGFLYGDVATAALDTPAAGIPTWALLFSPLPDPGTIGADGTGYHVQLQGYGNNGSAATGSTGGIDYRRRIANNMLGALASLDDFELFQFYGLKTSDGWTEGLPQNLYWIDFDDPTRTNPYDFNAWRDNAVANEGITASGDSGGPLILDQEYAKQLVIGVLSGGYTRFFTPQAPNGYGTASFYQPLYLYWDWIAANTPYHYVSAKAGDGAWEDPTHWVTNLDPNYYILSGGDAVNGIPTLTGAGNTDQPGFGQACFESGGVSDCYDVSTGKEYVDTRGKGGDDVNPVEVGGVGVVSNDKGVASFTLDGIDSSSSGTGSSSSGAGDVAVVSGALPSPTLLSGLPGATDFVPNNDDGDAPNSIAPRYFDVTLSAAGVTTLSSDITVDRFTLAGGNSSLVINSGASLTSLIDISQMAGFLTVDGTLSTPGDFWLMTGGLLGSGTINAPYFTNVAGGISPGGLNSIGTLTFNGNVILSAGSSYVVNIGNNGASDLIKVNATTYDVGGAPLDGMASVDGALMFSVVSGTMPRYGDMYTILTAQGGVSGHFSTTNWISAILRPNILYTSTQVKVEIAAGLYADVIDPNSPVQSAYAGLLDRNRAQYDKYADLFGPLDLFDAASIRSTLDSLAPRAQNAAGEMGLIAANTLGNFFRTRLNTVAGGGTGGTIAMTGQPLQLAALAVNSMPGAAPVRSDMSDGMAVTDGALPETMSVYLSGGYINGRGQGLPIATPNGRNNFDGFFIAGGIEGSVGADTTIGFGLGYVDTDGSTAVGGDKAGGKLYQGTLYAVTRTGGVQLDVQVSAGAYKWNTSRVAIIGPSVFTLTADDSAFTFSSEVGVGAPLAIGSGGTLTPRASLRYNLIDFNRTAEKGGGPALQYDLGTFDSLEGRLGATLSGDMDGFKPFLTANYVHDFNPRLGAFAANFVGGIGPSALFGLAGADTDWGEISGGISFKAGKLDLTLGADTTVGRSDVSNQTYHGSVTFRF